MPIEVISSAKDGREDQLEDINLKPEGRLKIKGKRVNPYLTRGSKISSTRLPSLIVRQGGVASLMVLGPGTSLECKLCNAISFECEFGFFTMLWRKSITLVTTTPSN